MPYPRESRQQLIRESNRQCDITTSQNNLQAHSVTRAHYLDQDGFPVDGMMIEASTHQYLHNVARQLEGKHTLHDLSLDAFRVNLMGIAASALSRGRFSEGLRQYLDQQYNRINEIQSVIDGEHPDARPMTRRQTKRVGWQYAKRAR